MTNDYDKLRAEVSELRDAFVWVTVAFVILILGILLVLSSCGCDYWL